MAERRALVLVDGSPAELPQGDTLAGVGGGGGAAPIQTIEVNIANFGSRSGRFNIPGSGMTIGKPVAVYQAPGPYTGKGSRADEAEMDGIIANAVVVSATSIAVHWQSARRVRGNFKFFYQIGG